MKPIRIGLVGAGFMGRALLHQCLSTPAVACTVFANRSLDRALSAARAEGLRCRVVTDPCTLNRAVEAGELAITEDPFLLAACDHVDVVLEATTAIGPAGALALAALEAGKHVVMVNAEADLIFGPHLMEAAWKHGRVYTSADGDQHTVIKRLADELLPCGFKIVLAGNIKGYLDRYATPATIAQEAEKRGLSLQMATSLTDGTKLNIEMALVANGLGLRTLCPGMRGPRARRVDEVLTLFDQALLREHEGVVDYILGAEPGGGVFIIASCDDPFQRTKLSYYKMGSGPYYLFYRHYHLCHMEALRSAVQACVDRQPVLQPLHRFRTNVYSYAKRSLAPGDRLDGIGGFTCYGLIENVENAERTNESGLPIALSEGAVVTRSIPRDQRITLSDVEFDPDRVDFRLFGREQRPSAA